MPAPAPSRLQFLCTDIGRGHPFYLDGIVQEVASLLSPDAREYHRVADVCGPAGRLAWNLLDETYRRGSSPGLWSALYRILRRDNDYNRERFTLRLLRRSLRGFAYSTRNDRLVVSHPLLVAALRPHPRICYQHGEMVTPEEAVVLGAHRVLVPTAEAAWPFLSAGYQRNSVWVTGLCIEPELVVQAEESRVQRLERLEKSSPLTGAFFSSGAEPAEHVDALVAAMGSVLECGFAAHVFASRGGRLLKAVYRLRQAEQSSDKLTVHTFESRAELNRLTALHFPSFDYFVAPPHERTPWPFGLGLPMFLLGPDKGPFAPLNRQLLLKSGGAEALADASGFGVRLRDAHLRDRLISMARRGADRYSVFGFSEAARSLASLQG